MGFIEKNNFVIYDKNSWKEYKEFCYLMDIKTNDLKSLKLYKEKVDYISIM